MKADRSLNIDVFQPNDSYTNIAYGNNVFIAVSEFGISRSADDGLTWTRIRYNSQTYFPFVSFVNGKFYIGTGFSTGVSLTSTDGLAWTEAPIYYTPSLNADATDVGTVNNYVANPSDWFTSYDAFYSDSDSNHLIFDTNLILILIANTNTGASTLDISGFGALPIVGEDGTTPVSAGDLIAGQIYQFTGYTAGSPPITAFQFSHVPYPAEIVRDASADIAAFPWAYGAGVYVAVGAPFSDGSYGILTSADGVSWTVSNSGLDHFAANYGLNRVRYISGNFWAVGNRSIVLSSADGYTWTKHTGGDLASVNIDFTDIVYCQSTYVINGSGEALSSSDGLTWTELSSGVPDCTLLEDNGSIYADGYLSTDAGTTWTLIDQFGAGQGIARSNSVFVAVGQGHTIARSIDGVHWTTIRRSVTDARLPAAIGSTHVALHFMTDGDTVGIIRSTDDGFSWTSGYYSENPSTFLAICASNSMFVLVGEGIMTSPTGVTWTTRTSGTVETLYNVAYLNSLYIAVGTNGTIVTSADAITWTVRSTPSEVSSRRLIAVAASGSTFVAIAITGEVITSTNGTSWTYATTLSSFELFGICYDGNSFVIVAYNTTVFTSTDGASWTTHASNPELAWAGAFSQFADCRAFGTRAMAYGYGTLAYSDDHGVTWTNVLQGYNRTPRINQMWQGDTQLLALGTFFGDYELPIASTDNGSTWDIIDLDRPFAQFAAGEAQFAYAKYYYMRDRALICSSDGVTWNSTGWCFTDDIKHVCYDGSTYVAVGDNGLILSSIDGTTWTWVQWSEAAEFTASIDGALMTVTAVASGTLKVGQDIDWGGFLNTRIAAYGTGNGGTGTYLVSPGTTLSSTTITVRLRPNTALPHLSHVAFGNGIFVAVGNFLGQGIMSSTDGTTWITQVNPTAFVGTGSISGTTLTITAVTSGALYVDQSIDGNMIATSISALGTGTGGTGTYVVTVSQTVGSTTIFGSSSAYDSVVFGNGIFICPFETVSFTTGLITSTDGTTWTVSEFPGSAINEISFDGSLFYAVGNGAFAATSPDGVTWTELTIIGDGTDDILSSSTGQDLYVFTGRNRVYTTEDLREPLEPVEVAPIGGPLRFANRSFLASSSQWQPSSR